MLCRLSGTCSMQMCAILSTQTCYIACENLLEADVWTVICWHTHTLHCLSGACWERIRSLLSTGNHFPHRFGYLSTFFFPEANYVKTQSVNHEPFIFMGKSRQASEKLRKSSLQLCVEGLGTGFVRLEIWWWIITLNPLLCKQNMPQ